MSTPYNYCVRCGEEFTERESDRAEEMNMPPMCTDCVTELLKDTVQTMQTAINDVAIEMGKALQPMAEQMSSIKADNRTETEDE